MHRDVKKDVRPSNSHTQESPERKDFFFFFCGSENRLGSDPSTPAPEDKEVTSKSTWLFQAEPRPAWRGGREGNGDGAIGEQGAQAGAIDWHRDLLPAPEVLGETPPTPAAIT